MMLSGRESNQCSSHLMMSTSKCPAGSALGTVRLTSMIVGLPLVGYWKVTFGHVQGPLAAALHAIHGTRLGEGELHDVIRELEVRLLVWALLGEHRQALALLALDRLQLFTYKSFRKPMNPEFFITTCLRRRSFKNLDGVHMLQRSPRSWSPLLAAWQPPQWTI